MSIKDNIKDNLSSKGKHRKERAEEVLQELKDGFAYLEKGKQPILSIVDFQTEYTNYLNNQKNN